MVGCCWAAGVPEIGSGAALLEDLAVVVVVVVVVAVVGERCWADDSAKNGA